MRLFVRAGSFCAIPAAAAAATLLTFSAVTAVLAASSRPAQAAEVQQSAAAPVPSTAKSQVIVHATWDDRFVYFALQVDDSDVTGTNTRPMSNPEQDDSVALYFHSGSDTPDTPNEKTNLMAISAAGGFTFRRGDAATKTLTPHPVFTIKFGVTQQGSLNRSDDRDRGYTVVAAVPLNELGLDPASVKPGTRFAFNAVVRTRGEKPLLTSLSPAVTSESETNAPSKWVSLILAESDAKAADDGKTIVAPRLAKDKKPPLVDGAYRAGDWPSASLLAFAAPDKPKPLVVVQPVNPEPLVGTNETVAPPLRVASAFKGLQKRLMARYVLGFQGDLRKATAPLRGIFGSDGTITLPEQPAAGVGPWFTYERTAWHRSQLTEMRRSGIDVALTQVGGPDSETGSSDEKALLVMVGALKELAMERVPAPQTALYLDTSTLLPKGLTQLDLTKTDDRELLYESIRRWMTIVPPEFRARVTLPPDAAGGQLVTAYPVFLSDAAPLAGANSGEWADDLRARFAKEFGASTCGTTLLLIGGNGFDAAQAKLAGTLALNNGGISPAGGGVSTFVLRPGRDDPDAPLIPRRGGAAYKERWEAALAANPDWIILDSWNDFARGTEVAASRQYGTQYADETRIYSAQASGFTEKALRWLATDAPRSLRPGQVVNATMTLQNASGATLRSEEGVRLVYRWLQNGQEVARSLVQVSLPDAIPPTRTANIPLGIAALKQQDDGSLSPLPEGDYVLQVDLAKYKVKNTSEGGTLLSDPEYFSASNESSALRLPITVSGRVPEAIQFSGTTTPPLLLSGGTYPVALRLRWLGNEKLPADAASIVYQILGEDGKPVTTGTVPLTRALQPGQWENVIAVLHLTEGGAPIPVACPEAEIRDLAKTTQGHGYRLRWLLTRTQSVEPIPGEFTEQVAVYPPDDLARILPSGKIPATIEADAQTRMTVTVINRGSQKWAKGNYAVGYHWYQPDGLEAIWVPPLTTPLPRDVAPGEQLTLPILVRAPGRGGEYLMTFDVIRGPDTYLSTRPVTLTGDVGLTAIRVTNGKEQFLDLRKLYDVDAVASEAKPGDGDFDGKGGTFPAESFPPDPYGVAAILAPNTNKKSVMDDPLYPSGYFSDVSPTARLTWFRYGSDLDGAKNAVSCKGQQIEAKGRFFGLHLAAAATGGKDVSAVFLLRYKDGTTEKIARNIGDWNRAPGASDPIAVSARRKRTPDGDVRSFAGVRHIIVPVDVSKELESITLPNDTNIKVFAITVE